MSLAKSGLIIMITSRLFYGRKRRFGALYNYHAVKQTNFPPSGWRVPNLYDLEFLDYYAYHLAGSADWPKYVHVLRDRGEWNLASGVRRGDNRMGFEGIPSSFRRTDGVFDALYDNMRFWCTDQNTSGNRYYFGIRKDSDVIDLSAEISERAGLSVRLVSNTAPSGAYIRDYEGNVYPVWNYKITGYANQYWTVKNWASRYYFDGTPIQLVESASSWETGSPHAPGTGFMCYYDNKRQFQ
jgi:uncharacterized protein (TIGR02145 family)